MKAQIIPDNNEYMALAGRAEIRCRSCCHFSCSRSLIMSISPNENDSLYLICFNLSLSVPLNELLHTVFIDLFTVILIEFLVDGDILNNLLITLQILSLSVKRMPPDRWRDSFQPK